MGPAALAQVLRPLAGAFLPSSTPDLLVGLQVADDAAVFRLNDTQAIVQTVDFFTPILDDPYLFGAVSAANAMSDVYAMGGEVLFALNIAAFPESLPLDVVTEVFRGGAEKVREAGAVIAGGHSIYDAEPKYGLAVTGVVHPNGILTKAGARPGDRLYLTKALGTGVLCSSLKSDRLSEADLKQAIDSMLQLNRQAARLMRAAHVTALTDITGFGLLGHADEVSRASSVRIILSAKQVPLLDLAIDAVKAGIRTGGSSRNEEYLEARVAISPRVSRELVELLYDPQTSGGLLGAVPRAHAPALERAFAKAGLPCWHIGEVAEGSGIEVVA